MIDLNAAFREYNKIAIVLFLILLGLIAGGSLIVDTHHAHSWGEKYIPFFWSMFAFIAAAAIIRIASWFGKTGIQVPTDFYDRFNSTSCEEES